MKDSNDSETNNPSGNELIKVLEALANPHRLKIIALLFSDLQARTKSIEKILREVE